MGHSGCAIGDGPQNNGSRGLAVPDRNPHASGSQRPDKSRRHAFRRQRDHRPAGAYQFAQPLQVARTGLRDAIGPVDARTLRTEEGTLQVQAEDSLAASDRARGRNRGLHLLARIADQRRQTRRGAGASVRAGNRAHGFGGRLIVEKNATAAIDLQIDEARGQERARRKTRLWPVGGKLGPRSETNDAPLPDQDRGIGMPAAAIEHTVRQDRVSVTHRRIVSTQAHVCPWQGWIGGATDPI